MLIISLISVSYTHLDVYKRQDEVLIGMGAIILNGAHIGSHSIIGAGALVTEHMQIPKNSIVVGCPAKVIKTISAQQIQEIQDNAMHYAQLGKELSLIHIGTIKIVRKEGYHGFYQRTKSNTGILGYL